MIKKWAKCDVKHLIELKNIGETISNISKKLDRTQGSVEIKLRRLGMTKNNEWLESEISEAIRLIGEGKNFKEIGIIIGKTHNSVTSKMRRLGHKSSYIPNHPKNSHKGNTKYFKYNWGLIQQTYNDGLSQREVCDEFNISSTALFWGVNNGKFISRTRSSAKKLTDKKHSRSSATGIKRYRQLCEFDFDLKEYPTMFDFELIKKYGWYKAKNRGDNSNGVNRDHMYSIKEGFLNNVNPEIIKHPANCELLSHQDNLKKHGNSSIMLNELLEKIKDWDVSPLPDKQ